MIELFSGNPKLYDDIFQHFYEASVGCVIALIAVTLFGMMFTDWQEHERKCKQQCDKNEVRGIL